MPYKDKEKRQVYINQWRREARAKQGLQKTGRKRVLTDEERLANKRANSRTQNAKNPYHTKDQQSRLLWAAKKRAKAKGLPFNLDRADIIIPEYCPYLKIKLEGCVPRGSLRRQVASLDRIIPELGYVKGNIQVISHLANTMKNDATESELILFAKEVLARGKEP